ncbi:hypothetical protein AVEN_127069-1 [Araneus ventricosus]|uniref:Uncharacterized protein n=1 Tax=Araneus ventricosus TaxID=182803 RepID=A0A4Y2NZ77_ARAVE|nr:hypothetical protein AVEN_127069-1 [Araneus ventricosus]
MRERPCARPFCISLGKWCACTHHQGRKPEVTVEGTFSRFMCLGRRDTLPPCPLLWDSGLRESIRLTQYGELWIRFADEYYHGSSWQPRPGTGWGKLHPISRVLDVLEVAFGAIC